MGGHLADFKGCQSSTGQLFLSAINGSVRADRSVVDLLEVREISPVVRPLTYGDKTISLTPVSRRCRLRTICGSSVRPGPWARRS